MARIGQSVTNTYTGDLPHGIWDILHNTWVSPIGISGDHARTYAREVALLASLGWISTVSPDGKTFGRTWHITAAGVTALTNKEHLWTSRQS